MNTNLERVAAKAQKETNLKFSSLAHHITRELIRESLGRMPKYTAPGIDHKTVGGELKDFDLWIEDLIESIHRKSYKPPAVRRVWIPKPGKTEKRPIGVPTVVDRALQRSTAEVLSAIYEEDLKNFFGSLDHPWMLEFVQHRVGDSRIISMISRWLKAGVMENGVIQASEVGTPQGGSISVLLSNVYLHYVLDLWFEKVVKPRLKGEAYLIRYIDDFVVCFQYRSDANRFQEVLKKRLEKFALTLEPNKTRLIEFGRFATEHAKEQGKRLETIYFLGFTHYCTRSRNGNFKVGRKTEKTRFKRSIVKLQATLREIRHSSIKEQVAVINPVLRGHYNYYGMAGNSKSLNKFYYKIEKYWKKMLSSRCSKGYVTWEKFKAIKRTFPLLQPKLSIPYSKLDAYAML